MIKLLFVTQVMDKDDGVLGAYHGLVQELAPHFERIEVICLKEGSHSLPENVRVHSLGKERGAVPAIVYAMRFKLLAWKLRNDYDAVFVHMNQEYILTAGFLWKLLGKRIYMWRNHYAGSLLTDIAAAFCTKVFCTSKYSYTFKYKKTVLMPVGVDIDRFSQKSAVTRVPRSILFLARIAPSKRPDMFIEALALLKERGEQFQASIYGSPTPENEAYYEKLTEQVRESGLEEYVKFHSGVPNAETPAIYQAHEISVNCSPSGMFDKTLFEAAASGCLVLAQSRDFQELAGASYAHAYTFDDAESLASCITFDLLLSPAEHKILSEHMRTLASGQSLPLLCERLTRELYS